MKRIFLFLATNLAVLVLVSIVLNVVLPMFGMWWLWRTRPRDTSSPPS